MSYDVLSLIFWIMNQSLLLKGFLLELSQGSRRECACDFVSIKRIQSSQPVSGRKSELAIT